ncbi:MAG: AbrB/MazE/SpoVT family DNA-binding domain-containing protein [Candidatus Gastranaerophilales bacterium]|nr:AbrB/MazE/SpoVT family DNA-binding domain-containing protein [Candidatus Gastranaerophilales bacterium]
MEKKLRQIGASYGVIIPKTILELLSIDPKHNLVKLRVEGDSLVMTKGSTYET